MKFNWGTGIVLFFIVFLSLATVFIIFSFQHTNDLVVDNYYEKGANYDLQMQTDKRSLPFKDSVWVEDGENILTIGVAPGVRKMADDIQVWMYYASDKRKDVKTIIESDHVAIPKSDLAKGRYQLKVSWIADERDYEINTEVFVN